MLLKVFLVDDEIATREGIRSSFPWDEEHYTLVGEAPDGEIALPMIADEKPDVVITDIRMPFMDGLALSRAIRRTMPWIHIVILSGYSDFEYAKQAISLGVEEYLLKPVTVKELRAVLDQILEKIQAERKSRSEEQRIRQQVASGMRFVQDKLLGSLLSSPISERDAARSRAQMENLGIHVTAPIYNVLDIRYSYGKTPDQERGLTLLEPLSESSSGQILMCSSPHGANALVMGQNRSDLEEDCYTFAFSAVYTLEQDGAEDVLVCIGEPCSSLDQVYESMCTARHVRHMVEARGEEGRRKIVGVGEVEDTPMALSSLDIQPLYEQLQYIRPEDFPEVFQDYVISLRQADMHTGASEDYRRMEAVLTASRIIREAGGDPGEELNFSEYDKMIEAGGNDVIPKAARHLLQKALAFRNRTSPIHGNRAVLNACRYLAQNFTNPNLMLQDAAKAAGMSNSRFSTVFAQEMGATFTEYLTGLRMGKARELLRATSLRSSEISSQVGYSDRHYFSYLFKKNTGMTPSEYREASGGVRKEEKED